MKPPTADPPVVLSFDVEEHYRIEAAHGLNVPAALAADHAERMERTTRVLLDKLAAAGVRATFYVVGEIARDRPGLVRAIAAAGHEVASHSQKHLRIHRMGRAEFAADCRESKRALEDAAGAGVTGYRAPTFSVTAATDWAIDELAAAGFAYDSSVFPVRHDRYGSPGAPRGPFLAGGRHAELLELPPATWRAGGANLPTAGGGYFRLFPLPVICAGVDQLARVGLPAVLYFHPWEFDSGHPRLPLSRRSRWRTYVGVAKTEARLDRLIARYAGRFRTAAEVAEGVERADLPRYRLGVTPNRGDSHPPAQETSPPGPLSETEKG